jgi:hypothetical protein
MTGRQQSRGIILVIVLVLVAVMSIVVVGLSALAQQSVSASGLEGSRLRTAFALRSGIEMAKAMIANSPAEQRVWLDGTTVEVDIGKGIRASISIRDAAGLVDINRARPALISALASNAGLSPAEADSIAKLSSRLAPLEKSDAAPDESNDRKPLFSLAQIIPVFDQMSDPQKQFLGAVGTYSPTGQVNPFAAPTIVLQSIPDMTGKDLEVISKVKKAKSGLEDQAMSELLERLAAYLAAAEPKSFIIDIKLRDGAGLINGSKTQAVVALTGDPKRPFQTVALSW